MAGITPIANSSSTANKSGSTTDAINDLDLSTFLTLMIKELQNQDPLNPLDNKDMLAQLSQIRQVGATDKLTNTLDSVLLGQNISSATGLIGNQVSAISDDGEKVNGIVDRISIDNGTPKLHVQNATGLVASTAEDGEVEAGNYGYRVVWNDEKGNLYGLDFSGSNGITTTDTDKAIVLQNLPATTSAKQIYRTDKSGSGTYQLVGTLSNGSTGTFVDKLADSQRNGTQLTQNFARSTATARSYEVSLNNVSTVEPPPLAASSLTY